MAAVSVTNDLQASMEVNIQSEDWKVVYPKMSCSVEASEVLIQVRLRESPEVTGSCKASGGSSLQASVDFGAFSQRCKGRDRAEARELAREGTRREEAQQRTDAMIHEAATKIRNQEAWYVVRRIGIISGLPLALILLCVAIPPESDVAAALLASATVPLCCCISLLGIYAGKDEDTDFRLGEYRVCTRVGLRLVGIVALLAFSAMTAQHALEGYWWTATIIWPVGCCGVCCFWDGYTQPMRLGDGQQQIKDRELRAAETTVSNRTIRFEGAVISWPRGRPCVASWPGKYAGAWESLVSQSRDGQVSAAVVFLPEGTDDYGKCDSIPEDEGLRGSCWCTPLYGEPKPWGCRWFTKWKDNIEVAVASGAQLEVYFFQSQVGQGKVESFESAGEDNLRREKVNRKQKEFEQCPQFQQALAAGLGNLSKEPRGDGSSQYSREVRRLFLASLPETEREFIIASEGLGNSQKAEVAWLEKKGYEYWAVDVATWLPGGGVEFCVPSSSKPQACGPQDDCPAVCVPIDPAC